MSGQMRIFAALPPVAMELEDGRAAESVLTLIGDKNVLLFPGITAMTVLRYIISLSKEVRTKDKDWEARKVVEEGEGR
jgi:hypothetical protein